MTRSEMEQCISLRAEIKAIEASLKSPKSTYVAVFYKDYRTGRGIPKSKQEIDHGEEEIKRLKTRLTARKSKLAKRLIDAEKFIEDIEDSQMRTILRMYYINGNTQKEIGEELHYSEARISQKITSFWMGQATTLRKTKPLVI